jgi:hypothetical protein
MATECQQSFAKTLEVTLIQTMYASSGNLNLFKFARAERLSNCFFGTNLLS